MYVGAGDGNVDALRASDGQVIWQTPVNVDSGGVNDKYNFSSPLVDRGRVYQGISSSCDQPLTRGGLVELAINIVTLVVSVGLLRWAWNNRVGLLAGETSDASGTAHAPKDVNRALR